MTNQIRSSSPIDVKWDLLPYRPEPPARIPHQLDLFRVSVSLGFILWCSGLAGCSNFSLVKKDGRLSGCVITDPAKSDSCEAVDPNRAP